MLELGLNSLFRVRNPAKRGFEFSLVAVRRSRCTGYADCLKDISW